jgi:acylphosphatase
MTATSREQPGEPVAGNPLGGFCEGGRAQAALPQDSSLPTTTISFAFAKLILRSGRQLQMMTSTDKPIQARRFLVRGRVQGVGFRWFVEREAHILGIAGWVRNNHDGSVEVLAQGTRYQLSGLHSRLREGPRAARVDSVEISEENPAAGLSSFRIEGAW